jgi:acyl phosphate:glycerol-3-phosphate acyltransferase
MNWYPIFIAIIMGYFIGAISMARIVARIFAPEKDITRTKLKLEGSDTPFDMGIVSATTVSIHLGSKYGFLTMLLDMLKIIIPVLFIKYTFTLHPYFLLTAVAGMFGHIWPVYYGFKGGRGILAVYGSLFAIDWIGVFVTSIGGMIFGLVVLRDVIAAYIVGVVFIIPWLWFRTYDIAFVLYAVAINIIMAIAIIPEIKQMNKLKREDNWDDPVAVFQLTGMGRGIIKMAKKIGVIKDKSKQNVDT